MESKNGRQIFTPAPVWAFKIGRSDYYSEKYGTCRKGAHPQLDNILENSHTLCGLYLVSQPFCMVIFNFFAAHWFGSMFFQTFFHHRYASHKMFSMNKFWERIFHFMAYVSQGSSYLVPKAYAIMHRMHHTFSDTEKDPHPPGFFRDVFAMMWHTARIFNRLIVSTAHVSPKFLSASPSWNWLDKFGNSWVSRIAWGSAYITFYVFFATQWWMYLLLPLHFLMGPVHGAIVNWCGHKYGYQNYDNGDHSKNSLPFDFLTLGELFQNNHHKHPNRPNFAVKSWEFDPMYPVLRLMHVLGIIRIRPVNA